MPILNIKECQEVFNFKIRSASFWIQEINRVISEEKFFGESARAIAEDVTGRISTEAEHFFYYYTALFSELNSCFDVFLQLTNYKASLKFDEEDVKWNDRFKGVLLKQNPKLYDFLNALHESDMYTFIRLVRNKNTHRRTPGIQVEVSSNGLLSGVYLGEDIKKAGSKYNGRSVLEVFNKWMDSLLEDLRKLNEF